MNITHLASASRLDRSYPDFETRPFFSETCTLLRCVHDCDFETLAARCPCPLSREHRRRRMSNR